MKKLLQLLSISLLVYSCGFAAIEEGEEGPYTITFNFREDTANSENIGGAEVASITLNDDVWIPDDVFGPIYIDKGASQSAQIPHLNTQYMVQALYYVSNNIAFPELYDMENVVASQEFAITPTQNNQSFDLPAVPAFGLEQEEEEQEQKYSSAQQQQEPQPEV